MEIAALGFRFVLALLFTMAGLAKLPRRAALSEAVANYQLLPAFLIRPVALAVPPAEVACGLLLGVGMAVRPVSLLLAGLLVTFTGAVVVNLLRGRSIDCGCFGLVTPHQITWLTVVRNTVLASMAVATAAYAPVSLAVAGKGDRTISTTNGEAILAVALTVVLAGSLLAEAIRSMNATRRLRATERQQG